MKAIVRDRYGSADVLELGDVELARVGADEVLVRVCAAGLDLVVWHMVAGLPYPMEQPAARRAGLSALLPPGGCRSEAVGARAPVHYSSSSVAGVRSGAMETTAIT
jgi:hypothetical protein